MPAHSPVSSASSPASRNTRTDSDETESSFVFDGSRQSGQAAVVAKRVNVLEHPIALHTLTALRNRETPAEDFRVFSRQLLVMLALEATRTLPVREEMVGTEHGDHPGRVIAKRVVLLPVAREGLGLAHHVAANLPGVQVGMISLEPTTGGQHFDPRLHLVNAPALCDVRVLVFEPVVATGLSATLALDLLRRSGATDITLLSYVMSAVGVERVQQVCRELTIWTAAVDTHWDAKRGPLPGLGSFGDRLFG